MAPGGGVSPLVEDDVDREDGPLHDPDGKVFDSTYADGAWDTLTFLGDRMVLVGLKVGHFHLKHKDGKEQDLQGGVYTMVRVRGLDYVMTIGGGD